MDSTVKMVLIAAAVVVVVIGIGAFVFRSMGSGDAAAGVPGPEMPATPSATAPGGTPQGVNAAPPEAPSEPR